MKILIIRLSSFGDVILTTPVLKAFKEKYPDSTIDFLVMDRFKDAIEGSPYVDNLIIFNKEKNDGIENLKKLAEELKKNGYDYIFDLHCKFRSFAITKFMGIKCYRYRKRSFWKTILVKMKLIRYNVDNSIVKNYFGAFSNFNLSYRGEDLNFYFSPENLKKIDKEWQGLPVFAPGASKNTKKWIPEEFGRLAKMIYDKTGMKTVIIGGKEDREIAKAINEISGGVTIDLTGKLSLKESGALLSKAKFVVTNDSGPFHIARGVGCRSFVIFGPTDPDMFDFGKKDILIYGAEKCSPCSLHGDRECPKGDFKCMKNITAENVMGIIERNGGFTL